MQESIHRYFQVGTLQWMSYPGLEPLEAVRRICANEYFDAIELTHIPDAQARLAAKGLMEQAHMRVLYGAHPLLLGPKLNPNALEEAERLRAEEVLLAAVDEAAELGATGFAFLAGKWSEAHREEHYAQLLRTTIAVCRAAQARNLFVELEVFDYDMDKAVLIGPAPLAARFAADVRAVCGNFGLLVDLSHIPTTHEEPAFVVRTLKPYITHFHIGNAVVREGCAAYGDQHPRFGFPNSANDVPELADFLRILKTEGFMNADDPCVLSFEVKPWGDEDADMVLAGSMRALNRAWAMVE